MQQIADLQDDVALSVERWRSRCVVQPYESAPSPILSDRGKLRTCKKSDLVECLDPTARVSGKLISKTDCKIFDGAALVHISKPNTVETF